MRRARALLAKTALAGASALGGCSGAAVPDVKGAAEAYAEAARRGDADALYGMMTRASQRSYGRAGVHALVANSRRELERKALAVTSPNTKTETRAELRFSDGELARLSIDEGRFHVASAGALPARARTPVQALGDLRQALARRSYVSLLGVLSGDKRAALEADLRSLVTGLDHPETLEVKVNGDNAVVLVPGGHSVKLKREEGVWRIDDFD